MTPCNRSLLSLASLFVACSLVCAAPATTKRTGKTSPAATLPVSEFKQMEELCKLSGDQLAKFQTKVKARDEAFDAWQKSEKGQQVAKLREQLAAAKTAQDEARIKALTDQLAPLAKEEHELRSKIRAEAMSALTFAQQKAWTGFVLNGRVLKALGRAKLTDEQKAEVRKLSDEAGAKFLKEDTIAKDPYLESLKDIMPQISAQVSEKVLTADQKKAMEPKPAATATKPTSRKSK